VTTKVQAPNEARRRDRQVVALFGDGAIGFALGALGSDRLADGRPVGADVRDLDAQHEAHPVEPRRELRRRRTLGQQPGRLAVVHDAGRMLDVPLRAEHEELGRGPRRERRELLGGDRVQPREPVRSRDAHDTEM